MVTPSYQKPNVFILGAPKCGTTAISRYLREHSAVYVSNPKETNYFCPDVRPSSYQSEMDYLETCFADSANYHTVVESSVMNLYSEHAVPSILAFNPEARFVVFLRHPIELFVSLYHHLFAMEIETAVSAEAAWRLQDERRAAEPTANTKLLLYSDVCQLGAQLARVYEHVPAARIHVAFYEDFARDPQTVYHALLNFLDVPTDGRTNFPVHNKSRATFTPWLQRAFRALHRFKKNRLGIKVGIGNTQLVQRLVFGKKKPLAPAFRAELLEHFRNDIELLEELTDRDLSHWKQ